MRPAPSARPDNTRSFARHLEGWQVGALTIVIAVIAVAVMVPRTVAPAEFPVPTLAPRDVAASRARASAEGARLAGLEPSDNLRLLAARLRVHGLAEHRGDTRETQRAAEQVMQVAAVVAQTEPEALLDLRAHLTERFVAAFLAFARTGVEPEELAVVGGEAGRTFAKNRWVRPDDPEIDLVLRALYKRRFAGLVGSGATLPLDPTEERARVRFLMMHPPPAPVADPDRLFFWQFVLSQTKDAKELDPSYPVHYARGVALFQMGRFEAAAVAFDAFLSERPDGPYRLRAINHLKAAIEESGGAY